MAIVNFSTNLYPLTAARAILLPALREAQQYAANRVKHLDISANDADNTIDLHVTHTLFNHHELDDGSFKQSFRSRVAAAIGADHMPNGRQLTVERRSFLARAARIRKAKPMKARPR